MRDQNPAMKYLAQKRFEQQQYDRRQSIICFTVIGLGIVAMTAFFLIV